MQQNALKELHKLVRGKILCNVPLSRYTSLRVGGPAETMMYPLNIMELQKVINFSRTHQVPYFILGRGTNLLIKDGGVRGIVIKLSRSFKKIKVVETLRTHTRLLVESGVSLRRLLNFSAEKGLSGLEFLSGIPGSTGGALWMNSGAYGRHMQDVTESLTLMTPKAEVVEKKRNQLNFDYRQLRLPTGTIIMNALIRTKQENPKKITAEIEKNKKRRSKNQPLNLPSAGSVFKNPPGKSAGQLVEQAGLKGFHVGEAKISEKHANFIINRGNATAEDILSLMKIMQNRVYQVTGIRLEPEIKIAGESERPG
jgi:UDP-N-acetylmuramate dehydrogenase